MVLDPLTLYLLLAFAAAVILGALYLVTRPRKKLSPSEPATPVEKPAEKLVAVKPAAKLEALPVEQKAEQPPAPLSEPPAPPAVSAPDRADLSERLATTRTSLFGRLGKFFGRGGALDPKEWEELEEVLLEGDVGVHTVTQLVERVRAKAKGTGGASLRDLLHAESEALFASQAHGLPALSCRPYVISIVGVNGVGKTTTIGKLAHAFKREGKSVLLGAADTFRAAAIQQLRVWSERAGVEFVAGREGGDPGAVAFDSVSAGKARGIDVVILDTAGRLHTKSNLMEELKKVHRVVKKVIPEAPHETWLVIDGTLGQNSVQQAREFQKTLELTGVIVTKLDGTAKGGAVLSIASELKLPIRFIGVGEQMGDLVPFEPKPFVSAILG